MTKWQLDGSSGVPLYLQLKQQIIRRIVEGEWEPGHQLPTVRQLAVDVSINVNTVSRVYQEVEREGYIRTQQGKGTFVRRPQEWSEGFGDRSNAVARFASLVAEMAQAQGITLTELVHALQAMYNTSDRQN